MNSKSREDATRRRAREGTVRLGEPDTQKEETMPRLIDALAEMVRILSSPVFQGLDRATYFSIIDDAEHLLERYDDMRQQEDREALLTNVELIDDEPSDYTALDPEYRYVGSIDVQEE